MMIKSRTFDIISLYDELSMLFLLYIIIHYIYLYIIILCRVSRARSCLRTQVSIVMGYWLAPFCAKSLKTSNSNRP